MDNIRPNLAGDYPRIDSNSLIDPSAQIIGNVVIAKDVFVGPLTVIRADRRGPDGKVGPIRIEEGVNIHDGVLIHSSPGTSVTIGPGTCIAHGVVVYGPSTIGEGCFLAIRSVLYSATLEDHVWMGIGAMVARTTVASFTMVPMGKVVGGRSDTLELRLVTEKEKEYMQEIMTANSDLRLDYFALRSKAESIIKSSIDRKAVKKPI